MASRTVDIRPDVTADISNAMLRWYRFSNEIMTSSLKLGQPLMDAYFQGLAKALPELSELARKSCEIPETQCPPYCVCELEWDACEGDKVTGIIGIKNTGKDARVFTLSAETFHSNGDDSGVKPQLDPNNFNLAPNEAKSVVVTVNLGADFEPNNVYHSEVKITGRYEQCVRLRLNVRRKDKPRCKIEHGEIPKRIVAHHWYDHFQCEEFCFEPVGQPGTPGTTPDESPGVNLTHRSTKNKEA
jgi:hypothetical protein